MASLQSVMSYLRTVTVLDKARFFHSRKVKNARNFSDFESTKPVKFDVSIDPAKVKENNCCGEILQILKAIRPEWCSEKAVSTLKTKVFTGGLSNHLYGYYQDGKFNEDVVLLRVCGIGTEDMVDRQIEQKNMQILHSSGLAPPLYALFNNGIAYGFVNGVTLDVNTVRDKTISRLIADEMVRVHAVQPEGQEVKAGLWDVIYRFIEKCPDKFEDQERQEQFVAMVKSRDMLCKEVEELKSHLIAVNSPVVFCHNDLLLKNIIYNEEKGCVHFIDHEYAMYNYEHYEIGHHFAEYSGVEDLDFSRYPDKSYQMDWLRYYLQQKAKYQGHSPESVTDKDVESCYVKTNKFALASHLFCGLWGFAQAKNSLIDFGYLEYSQKKLSEYFARKEEFFALNVPT